jgi:hypothetical protein
MSSGRNLKKIFEKMGGSEKAKPHSTKEGRVASGARKIRRILKKQKPDDYRPLQEPKRLRDQRQMKKGGRANFRGGGRTNLLEELGRVEAEPSNRNRRAEVSRVHRELNKGYATGGQVSVKKKRVGPETWTETHKYKKPYGRAKTVTDSRKGHAKGGRSGYKSGGAVLKGKKVGIQIK